MRCHVTGAITAVAFTKQAFKILCLDAWFGRSVCLTSMVH